MTAESNRRLKPSVQLVCQGASATVITVGGLVLIGWITNSAPLKSVVPSLVAMNPVTALSFILLGTSLWLIRNGVMGTPAYRVAQACALIATVLGCLGLIGYLVGSNLGIDQLLFRAKLQADGAFGPNRMAPNTAWNFVLSGLALLFLDMETGKDSRPAPFLALAVAFFSLLAIVGYAYGVMSLYGVSSYIPMAMNTAFSFLVLSAGILCARVEHGLMAILTSDSAGGFMARQLLPAAVGVPFLLGSLRLIGQRAGLFSNEFGLALFATSNIVAFVALIWRSARLLDRMDTERKRAEGDLRKANGQLKVSISELAQRSREMALLSDMGRSFQTCLTPTDAYAVVARNAPEVFMGSSGALYIISAPINYAEAAAVWGKSPPEARSFAAHECSALRSGLLHAVQDKDGQHCTHVDHPYASSFLCVPMLGQHERLGLLHLRFPDGGRIDEVKRRLAIAVAEQTALALTNISLRENLRSAREKARETS